MVLEKEKGLKYGYRSLLNNKVKYFPYSITDSDLWNLLNRLHFEIKRD